MANPFWTQEIPIWVSRPKSDGMIASFDVAGWLFLLICFAVLINVVGWSLVGIVELVQYVIAAL